MSFFVFGKLEKILICLIVCGFLELRFFFKEKRRYENFMFELKIIICLCLVRLFFLSSFKGEFFFFLFYNVYVI